MTNLINHLADVYEAQSRFAEALPLLRQALALDKFYLGQEHENSKKRHQKLIDFLARHKL